MIRYLGSGEYVLRKARAVDGLTVLADLRKEDEDEWDASILGGKRHIPESIDTSAEAWSIAKSSDDAAHITWGVVQHPGDPYATTWLLGTNEGQRIAPWVFHECRDHTAGFFARWPRTQCYSDERNATHHAWLEWMGYRLSATIIMGPMGLPFRHYIKEPPRAQ